MEGVIGAVGVCFVDGVAEARGLPCGDLVVVIIGEVDGIAARFVAFHGSLGQVALHVVRIVDGIVGAFDLAQHAVRIDVAADGACGGAVRISVALCVGAAFADRGQAAVNVVSAGALLRRAVIAAHLSDGRRSIGGRCVVQRIRAVLYRFQAAARIIGEVVSGGVVLQGVDIAARVGKAVVAVAAAERRADLLQGAVGIVVVLGHLPARHRFPLQKARIFVILILADVGLAVQIVARGDQVIAAAAAARRRAVRVRLFDALAGGGRRFRGAVAVGVVGIRGRGAFRIRLRSHPAVTVVCRRADHVRFARNALAVRKLNGSRSKGIGDDGRLVALPRHGSVFDLPDRILFCPEGEAGRGVAAHGGGPVAVPDDVVRIVFGIIFQGQQPVCLRHRHGGGAAADLAGGHLVPGGAAGGKGGGAARIDVEAVDRLARGDDAEGRVFQSKAERRAAVVRHDLAVFECRVVHVGISCNVFGDLDDDGLYAAAFVQLYLLGPQVDLVGTVVVVAEGQFCLLRGGSAVAFRNICVRREDEVFAGIREVVFLAGCRIARAEFAVCCDDEIGLRIAPPEYAFDAVFGIQRRRIIAVVFVAAEADGFRLFALYFKRAHFRAVVRKHIPLLDAGSACQRRIFDGLDVRHVAAVCQDISAQDVSSLLFGCLCVSGGGCVVGESDLSAERTLDRVEAAVRIRGVGAYFAADIRHRAQRCRTHDLDLIAARRCGRGVRLVHRHRAAAFRDGAGAVFAVGDAHRRCRRGDRSRVRRGAALFLDPCQLAARKGEGHGAVVRNGRRACGNAQDKAAETGVIILVRAARKFYKLVPLALSVDIHIAAVFGIEVLLVVEFPFSADKRSDACGQVLHVCQAQRHGQTLALQCKQRL